MIQITPQMLANTETGHQAHRSFTNHMRIGGGF